MTFKLNEKTKNYITLILIIVGVWAGFKYLSPLVTPFLIAFAFVALTHPLLTKLQKKLKIKKGLLTAIILFSLCITLGTLLWCLVMWILQETSGIFSQLSLFERQFSMWIQACCDGIENRFGWDSQGVETFIMEKVNVFIENFQVQVIPKLMQESFSYMKDIMNLFSFFAIMFIAAVLLAKDYEKIMEKVNSRPELQGVLEVTKRIFVHVGTFCKAQLIILLLISLLSSVTLFFSGIEGGIFLGIFTGFLDMLPFIGSGIVLLPLTFWQIVNGAYGKAVICIILYFACVLTREFLEPKLIGEKVGVFPVAVLFSVYAGVRLFGLSGILKGPLALIAIYEIYSYFTSRREKEDVPAAEGTLG